MANILSQDEVHSLLKGLSEGEIPTETDTPVSPDDLICYDFTGHHRIIGIRMPALDMINGRLCVSFATSLSSLVRRMVDISVDSVRMANFEKFHQSLPVPASLHIFRMEPLKGHAILALENRLGLNLVECYFGGKASGDLKIKSREYTAIENRMIHNVVRVYLEDLAQAWRPVYEISMSYIRSETNPQFAAIALPNDLVTVTDFNVEVGGVPGLMKLCIPYSTVEPIRDKLCAEFPGNELAGVDVGWKERLQEGIRNIMVEVRAELGTGYITGHRLLGLKIGDVIQLQQDVKESLVTKVEGVPKLKGRAGVIGGNKAVKIEQKC